MRKFVLYVFVFFSGFANLATEIIGPRLFSSLFGSTTIIWAIIISITLIGISAGYYLAGRIRRERIPSVLPVLLLVNALWFILLSWVIWELPPLIPTAGVEIILITALIAFFVPAAIFSMASPLSITLLAGEQPPDKLPRIVGNILALGTIGSVLGALTAAFILIPWVGLTSSLRIFALISSLFSAYFFVRERKAVSVGVAALCLVLPLPSYQWETADTLLAQRDGYYETVRVYSDEESYVSLHLGPVDEAAMNLVTGEPIYDYALAMLEEAGDVQGKNVLIIGGAGHTQARALERRMATVTEVEIDPLVISYSDQFFGPIQGEVIVQDGRTYVNQARGKSYDLVLLDAFSGLVSVPPQLTTQEFFQQVRAILKPDGKLIYNSISIPSGEGNRSFLAISATLSAVFPDVRAIFLGDGPYIQNIIFVASQLELADSPHPKVPCCDGQVLTDDLNPIEIYMEDVHQGTIFYRR